MGSECDPDRHGENGQFDRHEDAVEDLVREEVVAYDTPLEALVRRDRLAESDADENDDRGRHPPPWVADRDRLDLVGRDGLCGVGGRHESSGPLLASWSRR
jgi:hypothetical protein